MLQKTLNNYKYINSNQNIYKKTQDNIKSKNKSKNKNKNNNKNKNKNKNINKN